MRLRWQGGAALPRPEWQGRPIQPAKGGIRRAVNPDPAHPGAHLHTAHRDGTRSREETMRVKDALREWQSQQAAVRHQPVPR